MLSHPIARAGSSTILALRVTNTKTIPTLEAVHPNDNIRRRNGAVPSGYRGSMARLSRLPCPVTWMLAFAHHHAVSHARCKHNFLLFRNPCRHVFETMVLYGKWLFVRLYVSTRSPLDPPRSHVWAQPSCLLRMPGSYISQVCDLEYWETALLFNFPAACPLFYSCGRRRGAVIVSYDCVLD